MFRTSGSQKYDEWRILRMLTSDEIFTKEELQEIEDVLNKNFRKIEEIVATERGRDYE